MGPTVVLPVMQVVNEAVSVMAAVDWWVMKTAISHANDKSVVGWTLQSIMGIVIYGLDRGGHLWDDPQSQPTDANGPRAGVTVESSAGLP